MNWFQVLFNKFTFLNWKGQNKTFLFVKGKLREAKISYNSFFLRLLVTNSLLSDTTAQWMPVLACFRYGKWFGWWLLKHFLLEHNVLCFCIYLFNLIHHLSQLCSFGEVGSREVKRERKREKTAIIPQRPWREPSLKETFHMLRHFQAWKEGLH